MGAFVIFDVPIRDPERYREFMQGVKPALDKAGALSCAWRGAEVILEFPSVAAWESFYLGPVYQNLKAIRDECSSARLVCVEGLAVGA